MAGITWQIPAQNHFLDVIKRDRARKKAIPSHSGKVISKNVNNHSFALYRQLDNIRL